MTQWTQMMEKQRKEEWDLNKAQLDSCRQDVKDCIPNVQAQQVKLLEAKHVRDVKELNASQAKVSADTAKEVMNDKALKTKGDKDRRLKEKRANNIKKFMDEKKNLGIKQNREKEKLKVTHEKQMKDIDADMEGVNIFFLL